MERVLKAYVEAIRLFKKDRVFAERVYAKTYRETDPKMIKRWSRCMPTCLSLSHTCRIKALTSS